MARQVATFKMAIASRVKMQIDNNVDMTRVSSSVRHMPQIMWDKPKNTPNINSTQIQKKRTEQQIKEGVLFCFYEN